jgi:hypothetical protein
MWSSEDFPGAAHVPWRLLIRARYAHEIDAVVASVAVAAVAAVAPRSVVEATARAATVVGERKPATAEQRLAALSAVADFEEFCGTYPHHWWGPGPRPHYLDEVGDAITPLVLDQVALLVERAGSGGLRNALGGALGNVGVTERQLAA